MALRETLNRISEMREPTNERETINRIILPVLIDLGWDVYDARGDEEVRPEHPVGGSKKIIMDIALMKDNRCVCVVEAKRPSVKLTGDPVDQVLRYAFNGGVTYCVLTNGLEWRFYLPFKVEPEEREFAVLKLKENPIEQSENDLKRFLSREAVLNGDAERDAGRQLEQRQIDRELQDIWRRMVDEPDKELVELIIKRVHDERGLRPLEEQVNKVLARMVSSNHLSFDTEPVPAIPSNEVSGDKRQRRILGATLFGTNKELRSGKDMWIFVVQQVYARHLHGTTGTSEDKAMLRERRLDFLEKVKQLRARTRLFISGDYQDVSRYRPVEVRDTGIFVETDLKIDKFEELSRQLLRVFGYAESDLQIHEE